ncbi:MAG: phosphotransferase enzyme family protein [Fimbriimonas sp.]
MDFAALSNRQQIGLVRRALVKILPSHSSLSLATHSFNTTFRLQIGSDSFAIRVNINSQRTPSEVRGEVALVEVLAESGEVHVPRPAPIFDGSPITFVSVPGFEVPRPVVAYEWLSGRHFADSPRLWHRVGSSLRAIQRATKDLELPDGCERPVLKDVLDGLLWRLEGAEFSEALAIANAALESLNHQPRQLLHFDLHPGNLKVHEDQVSVFDFDDSVWSWTAADVAQSLFYARSARNSRESESEFWRGFGLKPEDLGTSMSQIEALVAGRALLLADDLAGTINAELREMIPRYLEVTRKRIRHFLSTGVFDPKVASMKDSS